MSPASGLVSRWILTSFVSLAIAVMTAAPARAAAGRLDPSFGGDGRVITDPTPGRDVAGGIAIQPDGRIVVAGTADGRFAVVRYTRAGGLDRTFSGDGIVRTRILRYAEVSAVAIQSDGRIVVAGGARHATGGGFAIARFRRNGTLDPTFGGDGRVTTAVTGSPYEGATDVGIQADGKIVAVGASNAGPDFLAVRYRRDGVLDPSFGDGGIATIPVSESFAQDAAVEIQPDGTMIVAGDVEVVVGDAIEYRLAVVRILIDGTSDPTFGTNGVTIVRLTRQAYLGGMTLQPNGKIVLAGDAGFGGEYTGSFGLVRLRSDGTVDLAFNDDGRVITNFSGRNGGEPEDRALDVAIQRDGKIVAVGVARSGWGSVSTLAIARYRPDGTLDPTFSGNGRLTTAFPFLGVRDPVEIYVGSWASAVAIQANGRIVAAGGQRGERDDGAMLGRFILARYLAR